MALAMERQCETCGTTIRTWKCRVEQGRDKFCSRKCYALSRKGSASNVKHSMSNTPTWRSWQSMKERIANPRCHAYPYYGGRGLDMDPRWMTFTNFLADMGLKPAGKTLGRIDNNAGYWPNNCRWEDSRQQSGNRRSCVYIEAHGKRLTMAQWARESGLRADTIRKRYLLGWQPEAIVSPVLKRRNCNA